MWFIGHSFVRRHGEAVRRAVRSLDASIAFSFAGRGGARIHELMRLARALDSACSPDVIFVHLGDNDVDTSRVVPLHTKLVREERLISSKRQHENPDVMVLV